MQKNVSSKGDEVVIEFVEENDNLVTIGIFISVDEDFIHIKRINEDIESYIDKANYITKLKKELVVDIYTIKAIFKDI